MLLTKAYLNELVQKKQIIEEFKYSKSSEPENYDIAFKCKKPAEMRSHGFFYFGLVCYFLNLLFMASVSFDKNPLGSVLTITTFSSSGDTATGASS